MIERRKNPAEIEAAPENDLLRRHRGDQPWRQRRAHRTVHELTDGAEIDAEGGLAVFPAGQEIADDRHVVSLDGAEQQGRPAIEFLHAGGDLELRIDLARTGQNPIVLDHARQGRPKPRVQDLRRQHEALATTAGQIPPPSAVLVIFHRNDTGNRYCVKRNFLATIADRLNMRRTAASAVRIVPWSWAGSVRRHAQQTVRTSGQPRRGRNSGACGPEALTSRPTAAS